MLYPYENYIKGLLVKGHGSASIQERLRALKLIPPAVEEIDDKRESVFELLPDSSLVYITPGGKYDFQKFLVAAKKQIPLLELDDLLPVLGNKRDLEWEDVILVMANHEMRATVMAMSVYGNTDDELIEAIDSKFRVRLSPRSLEMFKKYFWNIGRMTRLELYHFISSLEHQKLRDLLVDAFHKRDRQLKWKLSGENMLTLEEILAEVMNEAFCKFKGAVNNDDSENVQKVIKWADLAIKSAEKYKALTNKDSQNVITNMLFKLQKMSQADIKDKDSVDGDVM